MFILHATFIFLSISYVKVIVRKLNNRILWCKCKLSQESKQCFFKLFLSAYFATEIPNVDFSASLRARQRLVPSLPSPIKNWNRIYKTNRRLYFADPIIARSRGAAYTKRIYCFIQFCECLNCGESCLFNLRSPPLTANYFTHNTPLSWHFRISGKFPTLQDVVILPNLSCPYIRLCYKQKILYKRRSLLRLAKCHRGEQ